ncbi:MAG: hypothetical protein KKA99_05090, partial [Gammaproteobacteria bacterium]|nr:hypothetical protein [Gammaproteobacteria bacterium]
LISIPENLAARFRALVPPRQRSKMLVRLIEKEIAEKENELYACAKAVEKDEALTKEMEDWEITLQDGLENETR